MPAISVDRLRYTYPGSDSETLHGLSFEIEAGDVFGFLGPSGAGKSTTQKILIGLLTPYEGTARVLGRDVREWGADYYESIGVSFESPNHYLKLTARENLEHFCALYDGETRDPMEVLEWVDLQDDADKRVSAFSKGMKGRLNVARGLLHNPDILFLDEPTNGLDPVNARNIKDLVLELAESGTTVFVTTHNMMVADELCDRIGFITDGTIATIDSPERLKRQHGSRDVRVEYRADGDIQRRDFPLEGLGNNETFITLLRTSSRVETIHTQEPTLEEIFIEVTGEALRS